MSNSLFDEQVEMADKLEVKEDYKNAFKHYEKALTYFPNHEYCMTQMARMRYYESGVENLGITKAVNKILKSAMMLSNKLLKKYPKSIDGLFVKALIYHARDEYTDAVTSLKKALKIIPNNEKIILEMAKNYSWNKKYDKAIECFNLLLKQDPKNIDILGEKAKCHYMGEKWQKSLDTYDEILKIDPSAYFKNFRIYPTFKLKRYEDTLKMCNELLDEYGYDTFVLYYKIKSLYNLKKFEDAIEASNQIKPWNNKVHIGQKEFILHCLWMKGQCFEKLDKREEAEKIFLDLLKKSKDAIETKNDALEALGHNYWIQGEEKKAVKYFSQLTAKDKVEVILSPNEKHHSKNTHDSWINSKSSLEKLLESEESKILEFKSSLRFPYQNRKENRPDLSDKENENNVINSAMKTVCAFLNSDGGNLVIGVKDDKEILGIEVDFKYLKENDWDHWNQMISNYIRDKIGTEFNHLIHVRKEKKKNKILAVVFVERSEKPVYLFPIGKKGTAEFYTRTSAGSDCLSVKKTVDHLYQTDRIIFTNNLTAGKNKPKP
ncbi:MAG: tetratricopeptide repeat protein [Candidatus Nitrosopelagicus sp.]|jgi:tetratricopeptide (TPR) repeat protein|nr:tetratricopeptide repeat protein [Candidatus Nitrosopelagicus sp.]